jgi:hypothetical protein
MSKGVPGIIVDIDKINAIKPAKNIIMGTIIIPLGLFSILSYSLWFKSLNHQFIKLY